MKRWQVPGFNERLHVGERAWAPGKRPLRVLLEIGIAYRAEFDRKHSLASPDFGRLGEALHQKPFAVVIVDESFLHKRSNSPFLLGLMGLRVCFRSWGAGIFAAEVTRRINFFIFARRTFSFGSFRTSAEIMNST
jgi:hypothetical protein